MAVQQGTNDLVVVGARRADVGGNADQGAVVVIERTGTDWNGTAITPLIPTLEPLQAGDEYGVVAVHSNRVVVGARRRDSGTICQQGASSCQQGEVFVFERGISPGSWTNTQVLGAQRAAVGMPDGDGNIADEFGFSVALGEEWLVVGAPGRDFRCPGDTGISQESNCDTGAAYVYFYDGNNWGFFQRLTSFDRFLAPDGDSAPAPGVFQRFGYSVAIDGRRIAIGAPGTLLGQPNGSSLGTGGVFLYELELDAAGAPVQWRSTRSLVESDLPTPPVYSPLCPSQSVGSLGPFFGSSLDLDGTLIAIGAPLACVEGQEFSGRSYVFHLFYEPDDSTYFTWCNGNGGVSPGCEDCPCSNNAPASTIGGCLNSAINSGRISASGEASVANDTLRLELTGAPGLNALCVLIGGPELRPNNNMNCPIGAGITSTSLNGLRCIGAGSGVPTIRVGSRPADAAGDVGVTNRGWGFPDGPTGGILALLGMTPGQTRYFQVTYRDTPVAPCSQVLNTSNAVEVTAKP